MVNSQVYSDKEKIILGAAKKVFLMKGLYGARMQEIAEEAGINKALLHYYFRSKNQLFEAIFKMVLSDFAPKALAILNNEESFERKIQLFIANYIDTLLENRFLPVFVMNEINQNPHRIAFLKSAITEIKASKFIAQLNEKIEAGDFYPIETEQFITNILSLSLFPFIGRPLIREVFDMNEKDFNDFIIDRKKMIPEIILRSVQKSNQF